MTEYTGQNWPYEALQEAKKATPPTHVHVLLLGEVQDVDGIETILKTLSYLQKYGRPFLSLYNYSHKKPHKKFMFIHEDPIKHTSFIVPVQRLPMLQKMIKQRSNLVYEVQYGNETITNIPEHTQETFIEALKQALEERGWSPRLAASKYGMHYTELATFLEAQKKKLKQEHPTIDRWYTSLEKVWKTGIK